MNVCSALGLMLVIAQGAHVGANGAAAPATVVASTPKGGVQVADTDLRLVPAEPDFALSALPTTLRMPTGKFVFRFTHRFVRPIASGTTGEFFSTFFGFDGGARMGLELRYGLRPGTEVTFHRTSDRAIQFLGEQEILAQAAGRPISIDAIAAVEGQNNFGLSHHSSLPGEREFTTTLGAAVSHRTGDHGTVYVEPLVVLNAELGPDPVEGSRHMLVLGLGARWRLGQSRSYVVVEFAPRVTGASHDVDHIAVAIEKRMGGHVFQFNVSNNLGTTLGQVARGGPRRGDWFLGFNLTRKFF